LGHAPVSKLKHRRDVPSTVTEDVCVTCPMAKIFKLPFYQSDIATTSVFELLHIDIWGPYRAPTYKNHKFSLPLWMTTAEPHGLIFYSASYKHSLF